MHDLERMAENEQNVEANSRSNSEECFPFSDGEGESQYDNATSEEDISACMSDDGESSDESESLATIVDVTSPVAGVDIDCEVLSDSNDNCNAEENYYATRSVERIEGALTTGMIFGSKDEVVDKYIEYANRAGFNVSRLSGRRDSFGEYQFITYGCNRARKAPVRTEAVEKRRGSVRIDCKARICASRQVDGKWKINKVELAHNHRITPSMSRFYNKNKNVSPNVKNLLEVNRRAGINLCKTYRQLAINRRGFDKIGCSERDCRNHMGKLRKSQLVEGDADSVIQAFRRIQAEDKNFFYDVSFDGEGRLLNMVWANGRSRAAYKDFGDVIAFDTTYLVNRYNMPFAPFVGINHHGQSTLLGCALICNEKSDTFVKVFKVWLECMGNAAPKTIITYQCAAIGKAVTEIFPEAQHRWCLWHITSKIPEKLCGHKKYNAIKDYFKHLIYNSTSEEEFDLSWAFMVMNFKLKKKKWLRELYAARHRWAPVFVNNVFWGGMATTQKSESMNSFFDSYINARTSLKEFVDQYELAVQDKIEKELIADF